MATPLIKPINTKGGTFYQFTSAANDIGKTFGDDNINFEFSKVVALDIPDVKTPSNESNAIVWEALGFGAGNNQSSVPGSDLNSDENVNFAQSFQNYVLNLEQLVLNGQNDLGTEYDDQKLATVSERVFWKWLASLGAIRFQEAADNEANEPGLLKEEEGTTADYSRVVKYVGDIDVENNISRDGQTYTEVYLHIPVDHGSTPTVLFKTVEDVNYQEGMGLVGDNEYIEGRDSSSTHPAGLSMIAYYDDDANDKYELADTFGATSTEKITTGTGKDHIIADADGIVLNFDPEDYAEITNDPEIESLNEFNTVSQAGNFDFNCLLVYYDTYDESNPDNRSSNLYGILVLDDYENTVDGGLLNRFHKFKPDPVTNANGNSYGFKLNVKFDTSADNVGVQTSINDHSTFSMDLFVDVMSELQTTLNHFEKMKVENTRLKERVDELQGLIHSQSDVVAFRDRLEQIEKMVNNAKIAYESESTLLDLIEDANDRLNKILQGQAPVQLAFDLDTFRPGPGIALDTSTGDLQITNNKSGYSISRSHSLNGGIDFSLGNGEKTVTDQNDPDFFPANNVLELQRFENYFKNDTEPNGPLAGDLRINIRDRQTEWKTGQKFRIVFGKEIDINGNPIIIKTDSNNSFGNGEYGVTIGSITEGDLASNKPIIDIVCTDGPSYTFSVDVMR